MLSGELDELTIDEIGESDERAEFRVRRGGATEIRLVRCSPNDTGSWTVAALRSKGVLAAIARHTRAGRQVRLLTTLPAPLLHELGSRARHSTNAKEFLEHHLLDDLRERFEELASPTGFGSLETAWEALRALRVESHNETNLSRANAALAATLLCGAPGVSVANLLGEFLATKQGVRIDAVLLEEHLAEYGLRSARAEPHAATVTRIRQLTEGWLGRLDRQLLDPPIPRHEAAELARRLNGPERVFLLTGRAGGGKSAVLHQLATGIDMPILGFRLDEYGSFSSTTALGELLDLKGSPTSALETVARGEPCVLIIDQLDAVSELSGRMPERFSVIDDLIREALAFPSMRIVLACRSFDADHDHRIRTLADSPDVVRWEVNDLSHDQINEAMRGMGLDVSVLDASQLRLFGLPLNLVLLKTVGGEGLSFGTSRQLFAAYLEEKRRACLRRDRGIRFDQIVNAVAEAISARQNLYVQTAVLDREGLAPGLEVMVSEHVLVKEKEKIAFFHEAFFDYAFARVWTTRDQSLVDLLLNGGQEIFQRAQIRQIMNHLRDDDPERFVREVKELLLDGQVLYHLKHVVVLLLGEIDAPTAGECEMVLEILDGDPPFANQIWKALRTAHWFRRLDGEGLIERWLTGKDEGRRSRAIEIMTGGVREEPDRVAELLSPHSEAAEYADWLFLIVRGGLETGSRSLYELVRAAVRENRHRRWQRGLWVFARELTESKPEWALELLAAHLIERPGVNDLNDEGKVDALTDTDYFLLKLARESILAAPQRFCDLFLPYLRQVMALCSLSDERPIRDRHFGYRLPGGNEHELDEVLFHGAATAIRVLVEADLEVALPHLETLEKDPHDGAQWLLYQGLCAAGERLASWAAEILLQGAHRLQSGYISGPEWTTREVLLAISPSLPEELFARLEEVVLNFPTSKVTRRPVYCVFTLLSAMEDGPLSEFGRRRLAKLRCIYEMDQPPAPKGVQVGWVKSPVPASAFEWMTDDQWLRAIAKHNGQKSVDDWTDPVGGAAELAQGLEQEVGKDPERFGRLVLRLAGDAHPAYTSAVLRGLEKAERPEHAVLAFDAVRHIAALGRVQDDRWLGEPLRHYLAEVPTDIVEILIDRAVSSDRPSERLLASSEDSFTGPERLHTAAINSGRGCAAAALASILCQDADGMRTALVAPHLTTIAGDESPAVRVCAASLVHAALRHARTPAMQAFGTLIDSDDQLLATRPVQSLILRVGYEDEALVLPVINRMLGSDTPETREAGGGIAAFAAMQWGLAEPFEAVLRSEDPAQRKGAALVCAHRLPNADDRTIARQGLELFLTAPEEDVRTAAGEVAMALRGVRLEPFRAIIAQLIHSAAFEGALPQLLITIEQAPDRVDDLAAACARRLVEAHAEQLGDIRLGLAADSMSVSELLVRAYAQATSPGRRREVLELLSNMLLLDAHGTAEVIGELDR
ncbi:hypothetical protein ACSNOI_13975 [Actinomadura kijaniata]|uniref:hypothetical protein n=1 Tax=Actinomadura kijaniata TaxID=46161 RepID=UPI003F1D1C21